MILQNVKLQWCFLDKADDNGKFRVTMSNVSEEQLAELMAQALEIAKENGKKDLSTAAWLLGRREADDGSVTFTAKTNEQYTTKKGDTVTNEIGVYDIAANKISPIPRIANGATGNVSVGLYYAEYKKSWGIMMSLKAVQLIKYDIYEAENPFTSLAPSKPKGSEDFENLVDKDDLFK